MTIYVIQYAWANVPVAKTAISVVSSAWKTTLYECGKKSINLAMAPNYPIMTLSTRQWNSSVYSTSGTFILQSSSISSLLIKMTYVYSCV